jgi:hypothetical protein
VGKDRAALKASYHSKQNIVREVAINGERLADEGVSYILLACEKDK